MSGQLIVCVFVAVFLFLLTFGFRGLASFIVCLLVFFLGILANVLRRGWRRADELAKEFATLDVCLKASPLDLPELRTAKVETRLTGSQIIDPHLIDIIDYLLRDFVESWYQTITDDQQFPIRLKSTAFKATSRISQAMRQVDWVPLLTQQVVDDFASHIRLYRRSKEKSEQQRAKQRLENDASSQSNDSSSSDDLETMFFDLELEMEKHYCRDLVSTSTHYESAYLHDLTNILLYLLLPEEEFDDKPSLFLLREILVNKVFITALDLFSDPDFVNRTVVWLLNDIPVDYEHFLTIIEACQNGEELAAIQDVMEQEISFQRSRDTGGEDDNLIKQQLSSLNFVRKLISVRIRRLREGGDPADTASLSEFGLGRVESTEVYDLSLSFILTNSLSLSYFLDFLDGIGGKGYIDFYLTIEGFKTSIDHMMSTSTFTKGKAAVLSPEDVETVREAAMAMYGQFVTAEDEHNRVVLPEPVVKKLTSNINSKTVPPSSWFDEVQQKLYEILKTDFRFYPSFKRSSLYLKILNELKLSPGLARRSEELDSVCQAEDALDSMSIQSVDSFDSGMDPLSQSNLNFPMARDEECSLRAIIHDVGIGNENNHPFALYHIVVQKDAGSGDATASWNVTRRYSDFYTLHEVISKKFPGLSGLYFPGKKAFNNLSFEFLERRKHALNTYLKVLMQPRHLRLHRGLEQAIMEFLSQKEYTPDRFLIGNKLTSLVNPIRTGVKTLGSAVVAVPDTLLDGVVRVGDGLNRMTKTVFGAGNIKPQVDFPSPEGRVAARLDTALNDNIPLRILLLLMDEVFGLRQRNQWFRRQLVAFLQQLIHATFGSSINRKIVDFVRWLTSEAQTVEYLKAFKNSIWPGGVLTTDAPTRPVDVRMRTRIVARMKMLAAIPDELRLFIGDETSREGVSLVFEALQNPRLNRRLCYVLLERLLRNMFPGNNFDQVLTKLHSKSPRSQMLH